MKYLLTIIIFFSLYSCEVLKGKRRIKEDSTQVSKIDSGQVKKNSTESEKESKYQKETFYFDTTINNFIERPTVYIRETGTSKEQTQSTTVDSSWKTGIDSLSKKIDELSKTKETKTFSFWQIVGIAVGACLVFLIIGKGISKFKLVKI